MAQKRSTSKSGTGKQMKSGAAAAKTTASQKRSGSTKTASKSAAKTATKSKTQTKSTGKPQSTAAASQTQPKQPKQEVRPQNNQFWSVILCAIGIFFLAFALFPGAKAWLFMHKLLRGLFGISVFLVSSILFYTAYLVGTDRDRQASRRAVWGVLLTLFISGFVQIFFGETLWEGEGFVNTVKNLYHEGQSLKGGGLISGVIAWPLIGLFDTVGAKIIIIMLIVILLMLLMNMSFPDLLILCTKPFRWMWRGIVSLATRDWIDDDDDDFDDDPDDDDENEEQDAALPPWEDDTAPRFQRKSRSRAAAAAAKGQQIADDTPLPLETVAELAVNDAKEAADLLDVAADETILSDSNTSPAREVFDNIDVDIPIFDHNAAIPEGSMNPVPANMESFGDNLSGEEEAALQEMIANADAAPESNRLYDDAFKMDESIYAEEQPIPYVAPPLTLLQRADNSANDADKSVELKEKAKLLVDTLSSFGVQVRITGIRRGPTVTRYEIQPAAGVKISKITALQDDIGLNLGGESVRLEAPIPGKPAVGVEVPNNTKDIVTLREILEAPEFQESKSKLTFAVGKDIDGNVILGDIAKMPHMIIAGATGSGKSVCTNSIIMSILFHASPEEVRLVLVDPKVVEFAPYDGIPHLLIPVVTNPQKAAGALNWAVIEMERRYALCAQYGVRDLKGYNAIAERNEGMKKLPQILIMIDEFADLMMTSSKEVESAVIRIAQKARAAGMHLIIATQRPTVDVITGLIKSNVPSRIGMSVKSSQDSRNILDCVGAETLLGNGDLLFYPNGWREPKRVQGCFCSDAEVEAVASFLKSNGISEYDAEIMEAVEQNIPTPKGEKPGGEEDEFSGLSGDDALLIRAAELAVDMGQLSTTAMQRRLKLGYARAARIMETMEERGIIGPSEGAKPRKVLMTPQELTEWKLRFAAKGGDVSE